MKKKKFLDCVLLALGVFDLIFVIVMIILFCFFQSVPDTLIISVIGATWGEAGICSYIYKTKLTNKGGDIP